MNMNASEAARARTEGKRIVMIDVRTPVEYHEAHIEGSLSMPLDQLAPAVVREKTAGADLCLLVCGSGKRAEEARTKLRSAGCESLAVLEGGITAWEEAKLPLQRPTGSRLPLMRQVQLIIGLLSLIGSILALTVDSTFALLPAFLGAGLTMAGATGWCGLAIFLSKMPWNRIPSKGCNLKSCSH